jgi:hypothetical protein
VTVMMKMNPTLMIITTRSLMMKGLITVSISDLYITCVCVCLTGSSSTSYVGDSEDEDWAPIDSSEDVNELISDAQNIISNKK